MSISIRHTVAAALAVVAAGLLLAACGGGNGDDDAAAADADGGIVSTRSVDGKDVLADSGGRTLYTADVEKRGIRCVDGCTSFWRPVDASAGEARSAADSLGLDIGVVERTGGEQQLTLKGLPLYTFTEEGPGQLTGDGFVDDFNGTQFEWAAASAGGGSGSGDSAGDGQDSGYRAPY
jgi:predicted lipoprotein with Yx(FWY)xxD motif